MSDIFDLGTTGGESIPQAPAAYGAEEEPKADIFDVPKNAWNDVKALGPGLNTMGSLAKARVLESVPFVGTHNLFRVFPERNPDGSWSPSDPETIGKIGGAVGQNYAKNYVQPVLNA